MNTDPPTSERPVAPRKRKRSLLAIVVLLFLVIVVGAWSQSARELTPRVDVRFVGYTNTPPDRLFGVFEITNRMATHVNLISIHPRESILRWSVEPVGPKESSIVTVALHAHLPSGAAELHFRRSDTNFENLREGLDSMFRSFGIRLPGLNPDSAGNEFYVNCIIPAAKGGGTDSLVLE